MVRKEGSNDRIKRGHESNYSSTAVLSAVSLQVPITSAEARIFVMATVELAYGSGSSGIHAETSSVESKEPSSGGSAVELEQPEGGRKAAFTVVGAFLVCVVEYGVISDMGFMQTQYSTALLSDMSEAKITWIGALQVFMYYFTGAFVGRSFDAVGPKWLITAGTVLLFLGHLLLSVCRQYYQFLIVQGILLGVGGSLIYYPALSAVAQWYSNKRGMMLGMITAGSALGAVAFPFAFNLLIPAVGFSWAVRIIGFIALALLVPAIFLINIRLPKRELTGPRDVVDLGSLRDVRYLLVLIGAFVMSFSMYNAVTYGASFSDAKGFSATFTSYIVSTMNIGSLFGRPMQGFASDRLGALNVLAFFMTFSAITMLCWQLVTTPVGYAFWAFFYGFSSGAFKTLVPAFVAQSTPDMTKFGGRVGLVFGVISLSTFAGLPVAEALVDAGHGRLNFVIMFSAATLLVGAIFFWGARFACSKRFLVKY